MLIGSSDGPVTSMGYIGNRDLQASDSDLHVPQDPAGQPQPASSPGPEASGQGQGLLLTTEQTLAHCGMWQSTNEATYPPGHLHLGSDEPIGGVRRDED